MEPLVPAPVPETDEPLPEMLRPFAVVAVVVAVMWAAEIIDLLPGTPFDSWGIRPREVTGLLGIPLAPFLHGGFRHLMGNTLPFLILGGAIASGSIDRFVRVSVIVGVTSGLGVWLFARPDTVHIGASGLVFGYLGYLLSRGIIARKVTWIVGGLVVLFIYGGLLWGLIPTPGVSWTGHLFGALGGVGAAWLLHGPRSSAAV